MKMKTYLLWSMKKFPLGQENSSEHNLGIGCSVYVPYTYFNDDLYPETIISYSKFLHGIKITN